MQWQQSRSMRKEYIIQCKIINAKCKSGDSTQENIFTFLIFLKLIIYKKLRAIHIKLFLHFKFAISHFTFQIL